MTDINEAEIFIHNELTSDEVAFRKWTGLKMLGVLNKQNEILNEMKLMNENIKAIDNKVKNIYITAVAYASAFGLAFGVIGRILASMLKIGG